MPNTHDIIESTEEKAATVRSIADIIGTTYTDEISKGFTCLWFAIYNHDGAKTLHVQSTNTAAASSANVPIDPGTYKVWPEDGAKYALREIFIRVSADDPAFAIEIKWG